MFIDCSKLPDPESPDRDDVFVSLDGKKTVVVTRNDYIPEEGREVTFIINSRRHSLPEAEFPALLASIGGRPWGRLDRSAATRPAITRDPELVDQRLAAFGPHLRALREQYGLSMGDLARALGCTGVRLSALELAQPNPVRGDSGVQEDEGRAALAELLADTVNLIGQQHKLIVVHEELADYSGKSNAPSAFRTLAWEAIYKTLVTNAARAAMATILKARAQAEYEANPGTGAWHRPERALTQAVLLLGGGFHLEVYEQGGEAEGPVLVHGGLAWVPTDDESFARAAAAIRWPGVNATWAKGPEGFPAFLQVLDETALQIADASTRGLLVVALPETDDVAKQTARAGLAHLIGEELRRCGPALDSASEDFAGIVEPVLATDEARQLIRLHG